MRREKNNFNNILTINIKKDIKVNKKNINKDETFNCVLLIYIICTWPLRLPKIQIWSIL